MIPTDTHIVSLLQQQNKEAISILYDRYAPTLLGIVFRIVRSQETAEDVVQETFVKAWKNGASYDASRGTLFTWLLNIARNAAIDKTRLVYFREREKIQPLDAAVNNDAWLAVEQATDYIGLDKTIDKLEEKYRVVIDLAFFKGMTHTEITEELNIPLGTVKSRLRIALRELRKFFEEQKIGFWIVLFFYWFIK